MRVDARLRRGGLGELSRLLGDALQDAESVRACAERLEVRSAQLRGGTVDELWQSLVEAVDDDPALGVAGLLADLQEALPEGRKAAALRAWSARGARAGALGQAAADCARLVRDITSFADPRDARLQVEALAATLLEIVEATEDQTPGSPTTVHAEGAAGPAALAGAARRAAGSVRLVKAGLDLAPAALSRVGSSASAAAAFDAQFSVVGRLLDAVTAAEQDISDLLRLLRSASLE